MPRAAEHHARAIQRLRFARDIGDAEALRDALTDPGLRRKAAQLLGDLRDRDSIPALMPLLAASDPDTRAAAARALGKLGATAAAPRLTELLEDEVWKVRRAAASAVGAVGDARAEEAIQRARRREPPFRRLAYRRALRAIAGRESSLSTHESG